MLSTSFAMSEHQKIVIFEVKELYSYLQPQKNKEKFDVVQAQVDEKSEIIYGEAHTPV